MNKKLFYLILFVSTILPNKNVEALKEKKQIIKNDNTEIEEYIDIYKRAFDLIMKNHADTANAVELIKDGIDGMLYNLDPYTRMLEGSSKDNMDILRKGKYGGVGFSVGIRKRKLTVLSVMEESPSYSEGIFVGDQIIRVDSVDTKHLSVKEAIKLIKGEVGTPVELTVFRPSIRKNINFNLTRGNIRVKHVPYWGVDENGVGYIRITKFSRNVAKDFKNALEEFKKTDQLNGIIIDLRKNSGGLLSSATRIVDYFTERGEIILKSKGKKSGSNREWKSRLKPIISNDIPLVVLIDKNSASASEIVSGALQDLDRAVIVGQKSFGKGLIQHPYDLNDTLTLKITTAKYYLPSGRLIQKEDYFKKGFLESGFSNETHFVSKTGRKLYSGGGISPDVEMDVVVIPEYVNSIWKSGAFTNFAAEYYAKNPKIKENLNSNINLRMIRDFKKYLDTYSLDYNVEGEKEFIKLEKTLKNTNNNQLTFGHINLLNAANQYFDNMRNKQFLNRNNQKWIKHALRRELSKVIFGSSEEIKAQLVNDSIYNKAVEILLNQKTYNKILNL